CPRAFCAGIDVAYVKDLDGFGTREVGRELHRTFLALRTTEKPIVAAIDGLCLGAGLELAVSCDFMIATERSRFGLPNIHRGIPAIVEAAILPMAIGIQGAREMAYLGEFWDAAKAERRGLLQSVVPAGRLAAEAKALCAKLAQKSPPALATQKEIIHKWMTTDLESAIDFSINTVVLNWLTRDQKEGMGAFLAKRRARFKGE
ncbi:MAG: enoyl-CoA hydratase-related protein, partial [Betaproteobacteria bacterium]|nr:enoyl-CoA hydratase-related protein [Betaproteobacteria bacterium]